MQECTETLRVRADVLRVASDGDRTLEGSGELRVLLVDADGQDALLLLLGTSTVLAGAEDSFSYLLTSSVPVLSLPAIGSFILPPSPDKLSSFQYGIVLDSATPPSKQKKFHDLLDAFADLKDAFGQVVEEKHAGKEEEDKAVILGNKFSASIEKGSRAVAAGLLTGSKAVASRLKVGSDALIKRSAKGRDVKVDAKTKQRFKTASSNAKIACKGTEQLLYFQPVLNGVGAAQYQARFSAPRWRHRSPFRRALPRPSLRPRWARSCRRLHPREVRPPRRSLPKA